MMDKKLLESISNKVLEQSVNDLLGKKKQTEKKKSLKAELNKLMEELKDQSFK
ncbi:hypothetical protein [Litchfieldia alkalitelluris]|uniref:hypothetical protein n=1 Tax=Litchfieldia alkalitelluris TaxID=304268 RepID=UPI00147614B8|nr:hypothetical protein [Litchfieldia alkalitelluris]